MIDTIHEIREGNGDLAESLGISWEAGKDLTEMGLLIRKQVVFQYDLAPGKTMAEVIETAGL
jgi:hypothetical protein